MKQSLILVTHRLGIQACKEVRFPKINWSRWLDTLGVFPDFLLVWKTVGHRSWLINHRGFVSISSLQGKCDIFSIHAYKILLIFEFFLRLLKRNVEVSDQTFDCKIVNNEYILSYHWRQNTPWKTFYKVHYGKLAM